MNDNYAVINGKKIKLTGEQIEALGIETRKNPFERVANGNVYYRVTEYGNIDEFIDRSDLTDSNLYSNVNYFNDDSVAQQVALHQLLYRKLLKFAYDNGFEDTAEWDGKNAHWVIRYNESRNEFCSYYQDGYKARDVYFSSKEGAERAIKEVVEPFVKEHPEFVW